MRKLLVLNFFPAFFPPQSGGEQRYYHLYNQLSRHYDITLISPTHPEYRARYELVEFNRHFREHRIPKNRIFSDLHAKLDREGIGPECSALVCALAADQFSGYHEKYRELAPEADIIVHEFPYMLRYDTGFGRDGKPRIYNSHNFESRLVEQIITGATRKRYHAMVAELEWELATGCDLIFATSEEERRQFAALLGGQTDKIAIAPNGFDSEKLSQENTSDMVASSPAPESTTRPRAIFLGSRHLPNLEAARFIRDQLAPAHPEIDFIIMGSVCRDLEPGPANLILAGVVSETEKQAAFQQAAMALNPMFSGAGTNVKMLDFMAAGLAIVTTPVGARGLEGEDGVHYLIRNPETFTEGLQRLRQNPEEGARLGAAARRLAGEKYSWERIASTIFREIETRLPPREGPRRAPVNHGSRSGNNKASAGSSRRPRLLLLNDYPLGAARAGGAVRIRELFTRIARNFEVRLLCLNNLSEPREREIAPGFIEISIPKSRRHKEAEIEWRRRLPISVNDLLAYREAPCNQELLNSWRELYKSSEIIILEHPYLAGLLEKQPPAPGIPVIYEAHNLETRMKQELLREHPESAGFRELAARAETTALTRAQLLICVCESDRRAFARGFPGLESCLIENGIDTRPYREKRQFRKQWRNWFHGHPTVLFLGSAHPPNLEAARFIAERLCPVLPEAYFLLVGAVGEAFSSSQQPANLVICGEVETEIKNALVNLADVAINPMFSGGGSSLKIAEYLAAGVPVLSTPFGVRGFDLPADTVSLAEADSFPARLRELIDNRQRQREMARKGQEYVTQRLDWEVLAQRYSHKLQELLTGKPFPTATATPATRSGTEVKISTGTAAPDAEKVPGPKAETASTQKKRKPQNGKRRNGESQTGRLLVVTYRLNEPPLGGAEIYLKELLAAIRQQGNWHIEIATIALTKIENRLHFSAHYKPEPPGLWQQDFPYADRVHKFPLEQQLPETVRNGCAELFRLWLDESRQLAKELPVPGNKPLLLGGWHFPEKSAEGYRRWSSGRAEIRLPAGCRRLHLTGYAGHSGTAGLHLGKQKFHEHRFRRGQFRWLIKLPEAPLAAPATLGITVPVRYTDADPRELGIQLADLTLEGDFGSADTLQLDLATDFTTAIRAENSAAWVAGLIEITRRRETAADARFLEVRGPHSKKLLVWLEHHLGEYDLLLAHGVPFAPAVAAADLAVTKGVPYVCLPHFHMEDRFYHWQDFYRLFRRAAFSIAFPQSAGKLFFNRIEAPWKYFPGGGIQKRDFTRLSEDRASFRRIHPDPRPFFLVLGRKTGAKNYQMAIAAVENLRRKGEECTLVMIGRDEDGRRLDPQKVFYLGPQSDTIVRGALAESVALINMSESESFGIVLLEAWMCGRPVVVNRHCLAFTELVEDGVNGRLCGSPEELQETLEKLLRNPAEATEMGRTGRQRVLEKYDWNEIGARVNRELLQLLQPEG